MNPYLVMLAIRTALNNHADLATWSNANFSRPPKILIGNRDIDLVDMAEFPIILIVAQGSKYYGPDYNMSIGFGVVSEDYEVALLRLSEFAPLIISALATYPNLMASVDTLNSDGEYFHPKHTLTLNMSVRTLEVDTTPPVTDLRIGFSPDIGLGHEPDYTQL